jgi:hypothetical protein
MTRHWKIVLGVAIPLLLLRAALPTILARVIEGKASAALGRTVQVENVDLFLAAGHVTLEELRVGSPLDPEAVTAAIDPETALVHWPHTLLDIGWLGLFAGELRFQRMEVVGGRERLVLQADNRLEALVVARSEDSELPFQAPKPPESEEAGEVPSLDEIEEVESGWPLILERLVLENHTFLLINAADSTRPPIELSLAKLTVGDLLLADGELSVGPVGLRSPRLRVRRDLRIAGAPAPESGPPDVPPERGEEAIDAPRPGFRLASFDIEDAQLGILMEEEVFEVALDLSVRDGTLARDERFPIELRLTREDGWLELAGDLGLAPVAFAGAVRWEDFPVVGLIAAADPEIPLELHAGSVAGELTVDLETAGGSEAGRASLRGRVAARKIGLRHQEEALKLDCAALEVVVEEIEIPLQSHEPPKVALASVRIEKPAVKLVRRTAAAEGEAEERPDDPGSAVPQIAVGKLQMEGGTFQLIDESVEPTATTSLREFQLEGSKLRFPERSGQLEVRMQNIEGASLAASGDWREGSGTATVALQKLRLGSYSPYLANATGFVFERGSLSLDGKAESEGPKHRVKADLTFAKPALRDVKAGAFEKTFGISAPAAVSLLSGPKGNIKLPVKLSLETGTAIDVPALLIGAFRQSLAAVIAAPLKGLGLAVRVTTVGALGSGGALEIDPVKLDPGSAQLTPDQVEHAALVASDLSARSEIGLVLRGRVGEEDDPFLRAQALLARIDAGGFAPHDERGLLERRRLRRALEQRVRGEPDALGPEDAALIGKWLKQTDVSREARNRLANARAEAVRSALVDNGLDPGQVRIEKPKKRGPPGVAIELFVTDG